MRLQIYNKTSIHFVTQLHSQREISGAENTEI